MSTVPTDNQSYYDRFSASYERERHHGYHRLIDELELGLIRRYAAGKDVLEAGCGTGLLLKEAAAVARRAVGVDLSRGMLQPAKARGLEVVQGSLTHVPFPSASFDVVYSMKVLAHIPPIREALAELGRLVRPGGFLLLEFYNPHSLRTWAKRLAGPAKIAQGTTDRDVYTRYDTVAEATAYLPPGFHVRQVRGVRVVTPAAKVFALPQLGALFSRAEHLLCDTKLGAQLGGFVILVVEKDRDAR